MRGNRAHRPLQTFPMLTFGNSRRLWPLLRRVKSIPGPGVSAPVMCRTAASAQPSKPGSVPHVLLKLSRKEKKGGEPRFGLGQEEM